MGRGTGVGPSPEATAQVGFLCLGPSREGTALARPALPLAAPRQGAIVGCGLLLNHSDGYCKGAHFCCKS